MFAGRDPKSWVGLIMGATLVGSGILMAHVGGEPNTPVFGSHEEGFKYSVDARNASIEPRDWTPDRAPDLHHDPPFPVEAGERPTKEQAERFSNRYSHLRATTDKELDRLRAEGHLRGNGTPDRPYVLERFYVEHDLSLVSLHRSLILREGYVNGALRLNYVGPSLYLHHVVANDLRVNENVQRSGENTGGLIEHNRFAFVGQIRHFVGEFRQNEIGPRPAGALEEALGDLGPVVVGKNIVFNFDGFHTADVHHNKFQGAVDIKLHGHNHADCAVCPAHNHADSTGFPHGAHANTTAPPHEFRIPHSFRYTSLLFRDNEIQVERGFALRYRDTPHAADDWTANSEPNPYLNDPHVHFVDVTLANNRLVGGALVVQVFNSADENHMGKDRGVLRVIGHDILVRYEESTLLPGASSPSAVDGIDVHQAGGLELRLTGNRIRFESSPRPGSNGGLGVPAGKEVVLVGIRLQAFNSSNLVVAENQVASGDYGLFARQFTDSVRWMLARNDFRTEISWRGDRIENPPEEI